jgi:hypothetical protein
MVIRKLKQKKIVNTKVVSLFILLCVATYFLIRLLTWIVERFNQTPQDSMVYTLWATLNFSGKLLVDNKFPNYTHSLVTQDGNKVWLKSTSINLNAYVDQDIEFVGTVKKYFKITPVLEVSTLKIPDQWLILKDNRYFFVSDLLYLDFSVQPQLSATKSGSDIIVLFDTDPVVSLERFACSKILKTRDCTSLVTTYIQSHKDTFESYMGYMFYKHDTWFWTTFDANNFWFLFKDITDEMILDISSMFKMVNKKFVIDNKMNLIKEYCQDDVSSFSTIDSQWSVEYVDPYIIVIDFKWTDTKKDPATCKISFDMWNDWEVLEYQYN